MAQPVGTPVVQAYIQSGATWLAERMAQKDRENVPKYVGYLEAGTVVTTVALAMYAVGKIAFASLGYTLFTATALYLGYQAAQLVVKSESIDANSLTGNIQELCKRFITAPPTANIQS